jgi:hypothetical protein
MGQCGQAGQAQAAGGQGAQLLCAGCDLLQADEGAFHLLHERQGAGGGAQSTADSVKQRKAEYVFQSRQLAA